MRWFIAIFMLCSAACSDGLPLEEEILDYRLLAVIADPPEVDPDGTVQLSVGDFDPMGGRVTYQWSLCLFSFGSATNYECVDPSLQSDLPGNGPTTSIDFSEDGYNLRALYEEFGPVPNAAGELRTLEDGFEVYVRVEATAADGKVESAYKRVWIRDGEDLNTNPETFGWTIDDNPPGPVPGDTKVELKLDLGDEEREVDPDGVVESYLYQWLIVDGALSVDGFIPGNSIDYETPKEPGTYPVFVVIRDRRGGTAVERLDLQVR